MWISSISYGAWLYEPCFVYANIAYMKSTFTSSTKVFFRKLLGLENGAKLTRLPFVLAHVLAYSVVFFLLQFIKYATAGEAGMTSMSQFTFAVIIFISTLVLFPIHIRRAHDLGWSLRMPFYFSVLPAFLRIVCLMVPLVAFFNPELITNMMAVMPYIGLVFWFLNQVQLVFMVILFFAPSVAGHNRFGGPAGTSFTLENIYGFKLFKKLAK